MEINQIDQLIRKCLSGAGNEEDWSLLRSVLEQEEYTLFREELFHLGSLRAGDLKADGEKMWDAIRICQPQKQRRLGLSQRLWRYAALLALPLMIGGIFGLLHHLKQQADSPAVAGLVPGHPQAILRLNDGKQIDLTRVGTDTIFRRNGITVRLDSSRSVFYQVEEGITCEEGYHTILVPRGGEYRLVLADGSVVWLNSDSELRFPLAFNGKERKVFLKGEAYFDVARNPAKPFIVDVARMEVKVLGTQFNINAYREDGVFQTTLVQGKVQVQDLQSDVCVVLKPDQQAQAKDGRLSVREVDASVYTAWRDGKFYFEEESLLEIAAQLKRWYDIDFFFSREDLKQEKFTGVIRRDYTADQMLSIIAKTTNVGFEIKGRTVVVK